MLTLRQIEVIRAVMITGTLAGAARASERRRSRPKPAHEIYRGHAGDEALHSSWRPVCACAGGPGQINEVHRNIENLKFAVDGLARGEGAELRVGATPSIGNVMVPRAVADVRRKYADLLIDLDILKIEDAIDNLLLGRGEVAAMAVVQMLKIGTRKCSGG